MNSELAAIIVHDLKNALGILEGELRDLADAPRPEAAAHAHASCVALRERLVGFLTVYKAGTYGLAAQVEPVNPEDFLRELTRAQMPGAPHLRLSLNPEAMPAIGFFDENLVALALEAALQNAGRFARSRIEIGCVARAGGLVFSVSDDGPGLGAAEAVRSTGLGTELCRAIANAHRKDGRSGEVRLRNRPEGGAVFELRLP